MNILHSWTEGEQGFYLLHFGSNVTAPVPLMENTDDTKFKLYLCFYYPTHFFNLFSRFSECSAMYHFHQWLLFTKKHSFLNFNSNWNNQGLFCSTSLIVLFHSICYFCFLYKMFSFQLLIFLSSQWIDCFKEYGTLDK